MSEYGGIEASVNPEASYNVAKDQLVKIKERAIECGNLNKAGHASNGIAECLRRMGKYRQAKKYREQAFELFMETVNYSGIAWTFFNLASELRQRYKYTQSLQYLSRSYRISAYVGDHECLLYSLAGIAEVNRIIGSYHIAIKQHRYLLSQAKKLEDMRFRVWAYEGLGQMYKNMGHLGRSYKLFSEARYIAPIIGDIRGLGYSLKCLADILSMVNRRRSARRLVERARHVFSENGALIPLAYTYKTYGDIELRFSEVERSFNLYSKSYKMFSDMDAKRGMAYSLVGIGDVKCITVSSMSGLRCYFEALRIFSRQNISYGINKCNWRLDKHGFL